MKRNQGYLEAKLKPRVLWVLYIQIQACIFKSEVINYCIKILSNTFFQKYNKIKFSMPTVIKTNLMSSVGI